MRKVDTIELNGTKFYVQQLDAWTQFGLLNRIATAVGPAMGLALGGKSSVKNLLDVDLTALGPALEKLFEKLTREEQLGITRELLQGISVEAYPDGQPLKGPLVDHFGEVMRGRMPDVFKLLKFAFEVNYGSFYGALAPFIKAAGAASGSKESTTSDPSGPVGD